MNDCLFCKIADGRIKSEKVFEDDLVFAFKDINPQAPQHVLIIPKRHFETVEKATGEELADIFKAASNIANALKVKESGFRLVINQGKDAGQAVAHLHLHLLGGRPLHWPPG